MQELKYRDDWKKTIAVLLFREYNNKKYMGKVIKIEKKALDTMIKKNVVEVIQDMLANPDSGLEISLTFKKELKKSIASKKAGRLIPFEAIKTN